MLIRSYKVKGALYCSLSLLLLAAIFLTACSPKTTPPQSTDTPAPTYPQGSLIYYQVGTAAPR